MRRSLHPSRGQASGLRAALHPSGFPPGVSTPAVPVPTISVAPAISFAGSDNSVGILCTCTTGTWTGSPSSYSYDWRRGGVSIGAPDQNTYAPVSADAGTVGVASQISCEVTATNAGGPSTPAASNAITIKPYWAVAPAISGEPWPGGTVDGTTGTVLGATTGPTYEWEIGGAGTGDTSAATFAPTAAQYAGNLTLDATASNAGGASAVTSNTLALEPVAGFERGATVDDYLRATTGVPNVPSAGTILAEVELIANDGGNAILASWGRDISDDTNRKGVALSPLTTGETRGLFYYGPNAPYTLTGPAIPGGWGTPQRVMLAMRWNGSAVSVSVIVPGGSVTTTTGTIPSSGTVNTSTGVSLALWRSFVAASAASCATTQDVAAYNVELTSGQLTALAAAGSLAAWDAYNETGIQWYSNPDPGAGVAGDLAVAADIAGATWVITAGTDELVWGVLNEPS